MKVGDTVFVITRDTQERTCVMPCKIEKITGEGVWVELTEHEPGHPDRFRLRPDVYQTEQEAKDYLDRIRTVTTQRLSR